MRTSLLRWLSFRVRLLCLATFFVGTLLPPYVPKASLASEDSAVPSQQFLFVEEGFLMKTSSLGLQGSRLAYSQGTIHVVTDGESIESIARDAHLKPDTVLWANNIDPRAPALVAGEELVLLPVDGVLHTVGQGQTLSRIAQLYGVSQDDIAHQNNLKGSLINAGQELIIPGAKPLINPPGQPSGIASTEDTLTFTDHLRPRDIQLKLKQQEQAHQQKISNAPTVHVPASEVAISTAGTLQMPCNDCFYTQYYHPGHYAVDIQTRGGGPVFAAEAGTVIRADNGWDGGYGNVIEIDHGNGLVTLYGHNKELLVNVGDTVSRGQQIAWMGHTGLVYGATGIHTHFEVRVNGVKKNPLLYLE